MLSLPAALRRLFQEYAVVDTQALKELLPDILGRPVRDGYVRSTLQDFVSTKEVYRIRRGIYAVPGYSPWALDEHNWRFLTWKTIRRTCLAGQFLTPEKLCTKIYTQHLLKITEKDARETLAALRTEGRLWLHSQDTWEIPPFFWAMPEYSRLPLRLTPKPVDPFA